MDLIVDVAQSDQPLLGAGAIAWKPVRERLDPAVGAVSAPDSDSGSGVFTRLHRIRGLAPQGGEGRRMDERRMAKPRTSSGFRPKTVATDGETQVSPSSRVPSMITSLELSASSPVPAAHWGKCLCDPVSIGDIAPRQCDPVAAPVARMS